MCLGKKMNFEARQGMYVYSFSNWEAEAEGFEFKTSLYYTVKFCLKKKFKSFDNKFTQCIKIPFLLTT